MARRQIMRATVNLENLIYKLNGKINRDDGVFVALC